MQLEEFGAYTEPPTSLPHCNNKGCFKQSSHVSLFWVANSLKYVHPLLASLIYSHSSQNSLPMRQIWPGFFPQVHTVPWFPVGLWLKTKLRHSHHRTCRVTALIASVSSKLLLGLCAPATLAFLQDLTVTMPLWWQDLENMLSPLQGRSSLLFCRVKFYSSFRSQLKWHFFRESVLVFLCITNPC